MNPEKEVPADQFERVLRETKRLEELVAAATPAEDPIAPEQLERVASEMKKLDLLVADAQRCITVARGIHLEVAQKHLGEAARNVELAQMWMERAKGFGGNHFNTQRCLHEAATQVEIAQYFLRQALRDAGGKK